MTSGAVTYFKNHAALYLEACAETPEIALGETLAAEEPPAFCRVELSSQKLKTLLGMMRRLREFKRPVILRLESDSEKWFIRGKRTPIRDGCALIHETYFRFRCSIGTTIYVSDDTTYTRLTDIAGALFKFEIRGQNAAVHRRLGIPL